MLGKIKSGRRRGQQRMRWLDGRWHQPTQWRWVWVNSRSWWWTGRPGMLQSMGLQRVRHDWVTKLNWKMKWEKPCPDNILSPWIKLYLKADTLRFLSYIKQWISFWIHLICLSIRHLLCSSTQVQTPSLFYTQPTSLIYASCLTSVESEFYPFTFMYVFTYKYEYVILIIQSLFWQLNFSVFMILLSVSK